MISGRADSSKKQEIMISYIPIRNRHLQFMKTRYKKIYIQNKQHSQKLHKAAIKNESLPQNKETPLTGVITGNTGIDIQKLALLVNVCHLVADVNEQLVIDIHDILKSADPRFRMQFEPSVRQIRNHAANMVRFVDTKTDSRFSESFAGAADALKEVIMDYVNESIATNG